MHIVEGLVIHSSKVLTWNAFRNHELTYEVIQGIVSLKIPNLVQLARGDRSATDLNVYPLRRNITLVVYRKACGIPQGLIQHAVRIDCIVVEATRREWNIRSFGTIHGDG